MKLSVTASPSLAALLAKELTAGERASTLTMRQVGDKLKGDWRGQITRAGLGRRLSNSIRNKTYPQRGHSLNSAALVWSKAPKIISAHDEGALIRSRTGVFLAIPTEAAGKMRGRFGRKIRPLEWQQRTGRELRFVRRRGGGAMLVADDQRLNARGVAVTKRGKRRKDGILTGAITVPIFILVPQVKLSKRLNLARDALRAGQSIPAIFARNWKEVD